jgi:hypothetical protein
VKMPQRGEQMPLPLEHPSKEMTAVRGEVDRAAALHDQMARLEQERDCLKTEGTIALPGCWIETGTVKGRQFRQAWWRSGQARFESKRSRGKVKSCYIGAEGSPEHEEAKRQKYRRDRLKEIDRRLSQLIEGV